MRLGPFSEPQWRHDIERADGENHKRESDVEIGAGRLVFTDDATGTRYEIYIEYGAICVRDLDGNKVSSSADIRQAEAVVLEQYGDVVSVAAKGKNLNKFGRTENADAGIITSVSELQGTEVHETFVSTDLIDSIVSDNAGDTMTVAIEGHTIDGSGNFTFVSQTATLNGQTPVTLGTAMARCQRVYIDDSGTFDSPQASTFAGNIAVYDSSASGVTAGVVNTASATKMYVTAGRSQSQKCAMATASDEYWFITESIFSLTGGGPAADVDFYLEVRDIENGGVWRPFGAEVSLEAGALTSGPIYYSPYLIVPKNHDMRTCVISSANNSEVSADINGYLAGVQ